IRTSIGMFGPALAALLVRLIRREGFGDAGLRLAGRGRRGAWRMYLAAYLVIPALIAASIVVALLTGVQHWAFSENLQASARAITVALARQGQSLPRGFTADQLALLNILVQTVLAHAALNAQAGFTILLLSRTDSLLGAPIGIVGLLPMIALAIWLAASSRLKAEPDNVAAAVNS